MAMGLNISSGYQQVIILLCTLYITHGIGLDYKLPMLTAQVTASQKQPATSDPVQKADPVSIIN
jgi:hypothetical protein